jgi:septum formation protein
MRLILASTSLRRKELLALLRLPFEVVEPSFAEKIRPGLPPDEQVRSFAAGKARSCVSRFPGDVILGSDTLISIENEILGKPADVREAGAMLRRLRGRRHVIHTAVALVKPAGGVEDLALETVQVWMKDVSEGEIERYVRTGECLGKAGAYSIQGAGGRLIDRIEGDYTAAVGLPLRLVADLLRKQGLSTPVDMAFLYSTKPFPNWAVFQ